MQVIRYYAKAFEKVAAAGKRNNILICDGTNGDKYSEVTVLPLPIADTKPVKIAGSFWTCGKK